MRTEWIALLTAGCLLNAAVVPGADLAPGRTSLVFTTNYQGWAESIVLANGTVEAVIVPAVGRILQFKFPGSTHGPFWENPKLLGQAPSASSWNSQGSFGGDKIWPAPQSLWNWPPPRAYDSQPWKSSIIAGRVRLESPEDSRFGRCIREIELDPVEPVLRVVSRIEKTTGPPARLSVWTIAQVRDAERVFMPVPRTTMMEQGYLPLGGGLPLDFLQTNHMISFRRDPSVARKLGNDGSSLLWVGEDCALLMECPRLAEVSASAYPDGGCSVEVYTNPDNAPYIELETLGPLQDFPASSPAVVTNTYRLFRRAKPDPFAEAERILGSRF